MLKPRQNDRGFFLKSRKYIRLKCKETMTKNLVYFMKILHFLSYHNYIFA